MPALPPNPQALLVTQKNCLEVLGLLSRAYLRRARELPHHMDGRLVVTRLADWAARFDSLVAPPDAVTANDLEAELRARIENDPALAEFRKSA